jgi:hypothetical protein
MSMHYGYKYTIRYLMPCQCDPPTGGFGVVYILKRLAALEVCALLATLVVSALLGFT